MNKNLQNLSVGILLLSSVIVNAQNVGINATGAAPNGDAMLDISSTNKGLLVPRVNIADLTTITPVTGGATTSLLVYNTNATTGLGYYYWDGADWINMSGDDWKITGNGNTTSGTNFLGTTNAQALDFRTNNTIRFRVANGYQVQALNGGTETIPFYSWSADVNTGMWSDAADELNLGAGGVEFITLDEGGTDVLIFNEDSDNDFDVRMEGATNANMFVLDGSLNNIGIGVTPNANNNMLTVNQASAAGTSIYANTSANSGWVNLEANTASTTQGVGVRGLGFTGVEGNTTAAGGWAGFFDYDTYIDWMVYTGATLISDKRLKSNILNINNALKIISELKPVSYDKKRGIFSIPRSVQVEGFRQEPTMIKEFGFLAQDVELILPQIVREKRMLVEGKEMDVKGVNYEMIIPILTKAVQEQQAIIESQNTRLDELEQLVKGLLNKKQ
jgi:hypothetical protein